MDPENIARAIKSLVERYDTRYFMFADDLFNTSRKFAEDIADAFIEHKLDIMWSDCAYARDLGSSTAPETFVELERSVLSGAWNQRA